MPNSLSSRVFAFASLSDFASHRLLSLRKQHIRLLEVTN
jgi:hypothetical protein